MTEINLRTDTVTTVVMPGRNHPSEHRLAIRRADWERIKKLAARAPASRSWISGLYWACFGYGVPQMLQELVLTHTFSTAAIVPAVAVVVGTIVCLVEKSLAKDLSVPIEMLHDELASIEATLERP